MLVCADRCVSLPVVDSCPCYVGTADQRVANLSFAAWRQVTTCPLEEGLVRVELHLPPSRILRSGRPARAAASTLTWMVCGRGRRPGPAACARRSGPRPCHRSRAPRSCARRPRARPMVHDHWTQVASEMGALELAGIPIALVDRDLDRARCPGPAPRRHRRRHRARRDVRRRRGARRCATGSGSAPPSTSRAAPSRRRTPPSVVSSISVSHFVALT